MTEPTAVFGEFQDLTVYGSTSSVHAVKLDGTTTFETGSGTFRMYLPVEGSYTLTVTGDLKFTLNRYLSVSAKSYTVDGTKSVTIDYFREPGTTVTEPGGFVSFTVGTLYGSGFDVTLTGPNASVTEAAADQTQLFGAGDEVTLLRAVETEEGQYFKAWKDAGGNEVAGEDLTVTWSKGGDSVLTAEYYSPIVWQKDVLSALRADYVADLGVIAADADGNVLDVTATLLDASGEVVTDISECGGETLTVELTSLRSDEGRKFEATIEGVKVYGMPTITYQREQWYYQEGEDVTTMFSAVDSFDQSLEVTVNVEEQTEDGVYVLVAATDAAGNTAEFERDIAKKLAEQSYVELTYDGQYIAHAVLTQGEEYSLPCQDIGLSNFRGWQLDGVAVTDESGNSLEPWDKASGAYTLTADADLITYAVTYNLDGGVNAASNPSSYTVPTLGGADGSIALAEPSKKGEILGYTSNGDGSFEVTQNVYTFLGWYKDASFEQKVDSLTLDLGEVTLYAKWSEQPTAQTETVQVVYTREGDYIYFGEYPQTIKSSDVTVGDVADEDGYYLGSDGERYAKVVADPCDSRYSFSDGSDVKRGNTYYFKVEPIRWRILSESDGSAFILADGIIANHYYHNTRSSTTIEGETVYANNYKHSDIRAWLNGEFLNTAFGDVAQGLIETTEVDNSASNSMYDSTPYACENTFDKVFLLSWREVTNSAYGFSGYRDYDTARQMKVSDYARSTGAFMDRVDGYFGCGYWWLRSPFYNDSYDAEHVYYGGSAQSRSYVDSDTLGVVPALNITL